MSASIRILGASLLLALAVGVAWWLWNAELRSSTTVVTADQAASELAACEQQRDEEAAQGYGRPLFPCRTSEVGEFTLHARASWQRPLALGIVIVGIGAALAVLKVPRRVE